MEKYHVVSLSGGKDSTAMLLLMIELGYPIDAVLFADTGMEFPEMYNHLQAVDNYLYKERGIHITVLRHQQGIRVAYVRGPTEPRKSHTATISLRTAHSRIWVAWCNCALVHRPAQNAFNQERS